MKNLYNIDDWSNLPACPRVGEILIEAGKINLLHLSMALDVQKFKPMPLGEIFVIMKIIKSNDLNQALKIQKIIKKRIANENK